MIKPSHMIPVVLIDSLAFEIGCVDDDIDRTSNTSSDLSLSQVHEIEIRNDLNHKCLDVLEFNRNNGAPVGMWDCSGSVNQRWFWNGEEIRTALDNKCLDVGFENDNGAPVRVYDCTGGANQYWYRSGAQIRSRFNNKCLDLLGFNDNNGAPVGMWDCSGSVNQHWSM